MCLMPVFVHIFDTFGNSWSKNLLKIQRQKAGDLRIIKPRSIKVQKELPYYHFSLNSILLVYLHFFHFAQFFWHLILVPPFQQVLIPVPATRIKTQYHNAPLTYSQNTRTKLLGEELYHLKYPQY